MTINLDEITRALDERKKGKWSFCRYAETDREWLKAEITKLLDNDGAGDICYFVGTEDDLVVALTGNGPTSAANAHLIAHAPEWLRLLVDRVRVAEQLNKDFIDAWENYDMHPGLVMAFRDCGKSYKDAFGEGEST